MLRCRIRAANMSVSSSNYRVFFSHGGEDTFLAAFLKPKLEKTGAHVFLDAGGIEYGDDFRETILAALRDCDELLVLITASSLRRPWVLAEIGAAMVRSRRVVAIRYGPTERELQELGILSLLGTRSLLILNDFDAYVEQLARRVQESADV